MKIKWKLYKRRLKKKWHDGYASGYDRGANGNKCGSCGRSFGLGAMGDFQGTTYCPYCRSACGMIVAVTREDIINDGLAKFDPISHSRAGIR